MQSELLVEDGSTKKVNRRWHGHSTMGPSGKGSPTYQSWLSMKTRCNLDGRENADRYRDKGIKYCERWECFANFLEDMGERPEGTSIDRYPDHAGDYCKDNCRWATPREQARNTRRNKLTLESATQVALLRLQGMKCKDIAELFGISVSLPREIVKGRAWPDALEIATEAWNRRAPVGKDGE